MKLGKPRPLAVASPLAPLPRIRWIPSPTLGGGDPITQKIVKTPSWPLLSDTRSESGTRCGHRVPPHPGTHLTRAVTSSCLTSVATEPSGHLSPRKFNNTVFPFSPPL